MESWRCRRCVEVQRKGARFCQSCGGDWESFQDYQFQPQPKHAGQQGGQYNRQINYQGDKGISWDTWTDPTDQWYDWTPKHKQRPKSPRQDRPRTPSLPRENKKGKQKGKGKGKNKGKNKAKAEPGWQAPTMPAAPAPTQASAPPAPTQEQTLLKSLIGVLNKNVDSLPTEIQSLMQDANIRNTQLNTKQMVGHVKAAGKAREQLQEAFAARSLLHKAWKEFLVEAAQRWATFAEDFAKEDQEIGQRIEAAKEHLKQAKAQLSSSKSAVQGEATQIDSSDEDLAETMGKEDKDSVQKGMANMSETLKVMQQQASLLVEIDARDEKRRRKLNNRDEGKGDADASMPSTSPS